MASHELDEQLTTHLTDVHAIELQALEGMRLAPRVAGDPRLAAAFAEHFDETAEHERLVRERLDARGARPSVVKDAAGRLGGWGMLLFARLNPDAPGTLAMHAYAYEHMELAAYELLRRMAERAGDEPVRALAARIGEEERAMAGRVAGLWDLAVAAGLREKGVEATQREVVKYLRDAHALEAQAITLLEAGPAIAGVDELAAVFREHLEESRGHARLVAERLGELGSAPGRVQAIAMRGGARNLGLFLKAQPDAPVRLAGFSYALEALECGAYELLMRIARRAHDERTAELAERILADERAAAAKVASTWDAAVAAGLPEAAGLPV